MLPLGPHAHEQFDVVERPRAALKVAVSPDELLGVSSIHANVSFVMMVEVASDPYNVVGAPRV